MERRIRSSVWDVKFEASVRHPGVSGRELRISTSISDKGLHKELSNLSGKKIN